MDGPLFSYFLSVSLLPQRIRDRPTSLLPLHFIRAVGDRREPGEGGKVTKRDTGRAFSCEGPPSAQKREGRNKWLRECSFPWRSVPYGHSRLRRVYDMSDNRMAELNLGFYRHIFLHLSTPVTLWLEDPYYLGTNFPASVNEFYYLLRRRRPSREPKVELNQKIEMLTVNERRMPRSRNER